MTPAKQTWIIVITKDHKQSIKGVYTDYNKAAKLLFALTPMQSGWRKAGNGIYVHPEIGRLDFKMLENGDNFTAGSVT